MARPGVGPSAQVGPALSVRAAGTNTWYRPVASRYRYGFSRLTGFASRVVYGGGGGGGAPGAAAAPRSAGPPTPRPPPPGAGGRGPRRAGAPVGGPPGGGGGQAPRRWRPAAPRCSSPSASGSRR